MTMGLILLSIMMLSLLFSWGQKSARGLGLPTWGGFLAVIALGVGIIVPMIPFSSVLSISVGGFILPVIAMLLLIIPMVRNHCVPMGIVAMLAVTAATVGLLFIMPTSNMGFRVLSAVVMGLVTGALAFIIGRKRSAAIFAVIGGVALGNVIYSLLQYFALSGEAIVLGSSIIYNTMFLAAVFAFALCLAAMRMGRIETVTRRQRSSSLEVSEDLEIDADEFYDDFDDTIF